MTFDLRCHSCSHLLRKVRAPLRLVGLFRPSMFGRLPHRSTEIRVLCKSCRWVNVFERQTERSWRSIEHKGQLTAVATPQ